GTVALRVSITNLAASNASARCGDDATTTTAGSPTARRPTRRNIAIRATSGHRARASAAMVVMRDATSSSYASYSSARTSERPSAWSRTTPLKRTTAPHHGRSAQASAASTGRASSLKPNQSSPSAGGSRRTASWYGSRGRGRDPIRKARRYPDAMLFDDGDEGPVFREPPPADDRLWRHPSELGPIAATASATRGPLAIAIV